ncbi:MAG TPA: GNAT family N-acetyltransferase [Acidimicrobiales bacterium]|nr:GNAT family N-acetyltransferase [Acidimicrobiales bacterium]
MTVDLDLRPYEPTDEEAVVALLAASSRWMSDDQHRAYFVWKHTSNPFGKSPAWVATDGDRVVGLRTFLRWEFVQDGRITRAVRAVDTATHPDHQGRGLFTRLTRHALDELAGDGVAFVFNTPNERSRPGYLKMGWEIVGRLPVVARPRSPAVLVRLARARVKASRWPESTGAGVPAARALADRPAVEALLADLPPADGLATHRTATYLSWRYGFAPLGYRVVTAPAGPAEGMVVFRLRRRGAALEATVCEELVPGCDPRLTSHLLARALRESGADHAVRLGGRPPRAGFLPVPGQGPTLAFRAVRQRVAPPAAHWRLGLGDVELM